MQYLSLWFLISLWFLNCLILTFWCQCTLFILQLNLRIIWDLTSSKPIFHFFLISNPKDSDFLFSFFWILPLKILISCFFFWFLSCLIVSSWCWCTLIVDDLSNRFLSRTAARTHLSLSCYPPLADGIIHYPLWRTRFVNIYKT